MKIKENKAITLISLVVTVIVLLILAGISISVLAGKNGLISKTTAAKEQTVTGQDIENIKLAITDAQITSGGYEELNYDNLRNAVMRQFGDKVQVTDNDDGTYTIKINNRIYETTSNGNVKKGIDWEEIKKVIKAPESQKTTDKRIIGIGTDGNSVNMDLWEYSLLENGTYALNDEISANTVVTTESSSGYENEKIIDGKIIGTIPQFISVDYGKTFNEVSSMRWTFFNCTNLKEIPEIPKTIKDLSRCFQGCKQLITVEQLPDGVEDLSRTFFDCNELIRVKKIPSNVITMRGTFQNCTQLIECCEIPKSVVNMDSTFQNCTNLENAPKLSEGVSSMKQTFMGDVKLKNVSKVPDTVVDMEKTFYNCRNLTYIPDISQNVKNLNRTFYNCKGIGTIDFTIPQSVTNLIYTFSGCNNLNGKITINAQVSGSLINNEVDYYRCLYQTNMEMEEKLIIYGNISLDILKEIKNTKTSPKSGVIGYWEM